MKLARELAKRATGRTLYILDEPTTGLHFHDIEQLLRVLLRLRDEGNTIVVIEHNLDVIKTADWVIDLGPEGGDGGGKLVEQGNTVVVIEHNLDVIKTADHLIDLGPDGGEGGGRIVAQGTPEDVAAEASSYTGQVLAEVLPARAAKR